MDTNASDPTGDTTGADATSAQYPWAHLYAPGVPLTAEIPDEPLTADLERAAQRWPDRVAVDFLGAATSYAELDVAVRRAMSVLSDIGVVRGSRVALSMPNCTSHVVAFHAVLRLGAVVVELNPTYTAAEMSHLLDDCGAEIVVVWRHGAADVVAAGARKVIAVDVAKDLPRLAQFALRLPISKAKEKKNALDGPVPEGIADWHTLLAAAPASTLDAQGASEDVALLLYTGGTTGTPKAARLTHRNLVANVIHGATWVDFEIGDEVVYGVLPFFHAFGLLFSLAIPSHIGATLVAFPNFDPAAFVAAQRRRPGTFMGGVAPMFDKIVTAQETARRPAPWGLRTFRLAFAGAMPIPAETVARWEAATGGLVIEGYGMTECAPICLGNPATADRRPGTLGFPFPNTEMKVVDQDDPSIEVVADEQGERRGELVVRGPQVFDGYWNRDEETAGQLSPDGWLRTGDVVVVGADGWVTLVDRVKEMIIVGGFKVYPSQVEDHLRTMPGVADVAAVGLPDGEGERVGVAMVLEEGASAPTLEQVRAFGEQRLPRYALPKALSVVDELPRSQIGKVMRRVVRDEFDQS